MTDKMIGHFEEKNGNNKYLVSDDMDENKEDSKKYEKVWKSIKKDIETINSSERGNDENDF